MPTSATEVSKKDLVTETGGTGTTIVGGLLTNQHYSCSASCDEIVGRACHNLRFRVAI